MADVPDDAVAYLRGAATGVEVGERVLAVLQELPFAVKVRTTKSQVSFRRRKGFAYLWLPGQHLRHPRTDLVLSIAASRRFDSDRWAEIVQPSPHRWMHHLDIHSVDDVDEEVVGWLIEAAEAAA